jgi:pyrroline-5-carboxylate reductase
MLPPTLVLIGYGAMGAAMLPGWLPVFKEIWVVEPTLKTALASGVHHAAAAHHVPLQPAMYVFAVKPQNMQAVASQWRGRIGADSIALSIAAGITRQQLAQWLDAPTAHIARAMPNLAAAYGASVTGLCAEGPARQACEHALKFLGEVVVLDGEALMHPFTALFGSGPAYVALFVQALAEQAASLGLKEGQAQQLVQRLIQGSLESMQGKPALHFADRVTSPAGTTAAARHVLEHPATGLAPLLARAIEAAAQRSQALSQN